jgi:hypothetical protein
MLAGVMIEALSLAFPLYARFAGSFNTYGAQFGLFFLLATWLYLLSEVLLIGAVYNRFRLGEPDTKGLIASPEHESHEAERPVDVIKRKKRDGAPEPQPAPEPEAESRSMFERAVLFVVVGLAVAGGMIRRRAARGRRSIAG